MSFFRKYQKPILFTAVLFALVTFSIPVALTGFFTPSSAHKGSTMMLPGGRQIHVTAEDYAVAAGLAAAQSDLATVLPDLTSQDNSGLRDRLAALRRLAVEYGIDASEDEVDRAIAQVLKRFPDIKSPTQLALSRYSSLAAYRNVMREALRVGTFLRLQAVGVDTTDAALAQYLTEQEDVLTLRVATLDKSLLEESLKETGVGDDELRAWIEELPDDEKRPYLDFNLASFVAVGLRYEDFDASEFAEELGDRADAITEAELRSQYAMLRDRLFRKPESGGEDGENAEKPETPENNGENKDGDDGGDGVDAQDPEQGAAATAEPAAAAQDPYLPFEEVSERLKKMVLSEAALDAIRTGELQNLEVAHMRPAIARRNEALRATGAARKALTSARVELADDAENDELKTAVEEAETAVETAEKAEKDAEEALASHRKGLDFHAEMTRILGTRKGMVSHRFDDPVEGTMLQDLGDLGEWPAAAGSLANSLSSGDISAVVQRTDTACFHFQTPEVVKNPLKPFEDIAEEARTHYFATRADEIAEADKEKLEKALLDLAKAQVPEKIAEIEQEHRDKAERDFAEWKTKVETDLAEAAAALKSYGDRKESRTYKLWVAEEARLTDELAKAEDKRVEIEKSSEEATEAAIVEEAKKHYPTVLADAVADTAFAIRDLEPYSEQLSRKPRFRHRYTEDVQFLYGDSAVTELKTGEVTDILEDTTGRALHVAVCTAREPSTIGDLTRRQMLEARQRFASERLSLGVRQSFGADALAARWALQEFTRGPDDGETAGPDPEKKGSKASTEEGK